MGGVIGGKRSVQLWIASGVVFALTAITVLALQRDNSEALALSDDNQVFQQASAEIDAPETSPTTISGIIQPSTTEATVVGSVDPGSETTTKDQTETTEHEHTNTDTKPEANATSHSGHSSGQTSSIVAKTDRSNSSGFSAMNISDFTLSNAKFEAGGQHGSVRFVCHASHFSYDDPIVFPGEVGRAHLHMFFGNTGADANSNFDSLTSSGDGTCQGGPLNRTSYWIPALHDAAGDVRVPQYSLIYYKAGPLSKERLGNNAPTIQPFPDGLKMIAGNAIASNPGENTAPYEWYCGWPKTDKTQVGKTIPNCPRGSFVSLKLDFPNCWDGKNLDSANHQSHMAYSVYLKGCPASHPVALPQVTYNMHWNNNDGPSNGWYLSSDRHGSHSVPGGTTTHADWFGAWHPQVMDMWINNCSNADHDCKGATIAPGTRLEVPYSKWLGNNYSMYESNRDPIKLTVEDVEAGRY